MIPSLLVLKGASDCLLSPPLEATYLRVQKAPSVIAAPHLPDALALLCFALLYVGAQRFVARERIRQAAFHAK